MSDEQPERYVVTYDQLDDLIFHHQEIVRRAFQKYSTTNAQLNADKALKDCQKIKVPYWATHFAVKRKMETEKGEVVASCWETERMIQS